MSHFKGGIAALLAVALVELVAGPASATITSYTVPISGAQDAIIDNLHHTVDVTTTTDVQRYDLATHALLTPWSAVGASLRSVDITTDQNFLYIADQSAGPTQGVIRKVNTSTGAKANIFYNLAGEGAGAYDIVRLSNNKMLFTANNQFSGGGSPVRFIDLSNDSVTTRANDGVERQTDLFRSADGRRVFMTGGNTSAGDVRVYDAPSDTYKVATNVWAPLNGIAAALSPNGSLLSFEGFNVTLSVVHADDFSLVDALPTYRSGLGFSPSGLLYMADWETELFRIYDPSTLSQVGSFPAGFDLDPFIVGNMIFSADGGTMVYQTGSGLHVFEGVPEPASMTMMGTGVAMLALRRRRVREC